MPPNQTASDHALRRRVSLRFSLAYALMMVGSGVQLPFLPLWLSDRGLSVGEIAFILSAMMAARAVASPLFAWVADKYVPRRTVLMFCAFAAFVAYAAMSTMVGFWPIAIFAVLAGFLFAPVFPLTEGFSVDASAALGLDYGRLRMWASLSFLAGSLGAGALLTVVDASQAAAILAAAQGLAVISSLLLPGESDALRKSMPSVVMPPGRSTARFLFGSSFSLLILIAGLGQASHGALYSISSLHWHSLGFSSFHIGVLWTAAVLAEVTLFFFSKSLVQKLGPGTILLIGLAGGAVRWSGMAYFENYYALLVMQMLHVLSFAMAHLGTMHLIRLLTPDRIRNRAQGLYSAITGGVLMAFTAWLSGLLYELIGAQAFLAMASLSLLALAGGLMLFRINPRVRALAAA